MLTIKEITKLNSRTTTRQLSKGAAQLLYNGCKEYRNQSLKHLGYQPNESEAEDKVKQVLAQLREGRGEISEKEVKVECDKLPYPFNLWFC